MAVISASNYTSHTEHVILPRDIDKLIESLRKAAVGLPDEAYELTEDEEVELAALTAFRDEVVRVTGKLFDEATIVPEDEFEDYARDWASEIENIELVDAYVDWKRFADALKNNDYAYSRLCQGDEDRVTDVDGARVILLMEHDVEELAVQS